MLPAAFWIVSLTVALGLGLVSAAMVGRPGGASRVAPVAYLHGAAGLCGTLALAAALGGPARRTTNGAGSFGTIAAALLATALLIGALLLAQRLRRRGASPLAIGLHASIGVAGYVILAAYYAA